nr:hypothetical protein [Tanacetum cinerariifolium]
MAKKMKADNAGRGKYEVNEVFSTIINDGYMQLGESLRKDGPELGIEFDELATDAYGMPIASSRSSILRVLGIKIVFFGFSKSSSLTRFPKIGSLEGVDGGKNGIQFQFSVLWHWQKIDHYLLCIAVRMCVL